MVTTADLRISVLIIHKQITFHNGPIFYKVHWQNHILLVTANNLWQIAMFVYMYSGCGADLLSCHDI